MGGKHQLHSLGLKTENNKHQTKSRNTCWGQVRNENSLTKLIPLSILWTNQEYYYSSWKEYQSITASCLNFGQTHHWLHIYFTILQAWWKEVASEWSVLTINLITLAKAWNQGLGLAPYGLCLPQLLLLLWQVNYMRTVMSTQENYKWDENGLLRQKALAKSRVLLQSLNELGSLDFALSVNKKHNIAQSEKVPTYLWEMLENRMSFNLKKSLIRE